MVKIYCDTGSGTERGGSMTEEKELPETKKK